VRAELLAALLGWTMPDSDASLVSYNGGRVIDMNPAWFWYSYEFVAEKRITSDMDGVDDALAAQYTDDFLKIYTQYAVFDKGTLPLTGTTPQLPTNLLTPALTELFGPEFQFNDAFSSAYNTLDSAAG
jgi:hypothetical protein